MRASNFSWNEVLAVFRRLGRLHLRNEFISGSVNGLEMNWIGRLRLELLPQMQYLIVNCAGGRVTVISPDCAEELDARDDLVWNRNKELQQSELKTRQIHGRAGSSCLMTAKVDLNVTELGDITVSRNLRVSSLGTIYTTEQIIPRERE